MYDEANIMTIEVPEELRFNKRDLSYGKVRDFLMFNNKIKLISIGVLAVNLDDSNLNFKTETSRGAVYNKKNDSDSEDDFSINNLNRDSNMNSIYDQFTSELNNNRRLVMHPYSDFKINPKDYIICMGELRLSTAREFLKDEEVSIPASPYSHPDPLTSNSQF